MPHSIIDTITEYLDLHASIWFSVELYAFYVGGYTLTVLTHHLFIVYFLLTQAEHEIALLKLRHEKVLTSQIIHVHLSCHILTLLKL